MKGACGLDGEKGDKGKLVSQAAQGWQDEKERLGILVCQASLGHLAKRA